MLLKRDENASANRDRSVWADVDDPGCRDVVEFALAALKIAINRWNLAFLMHLNRDR